MDAIIEFLKGIFAQAGNYVSTFDGVLLALIAFFAVIPGDQPEKFLQGVVDFIEKFSRKPSDPQ